MLSVSNEALPLLGGEGQVDHGALDVGGDEVPRQVRVGQRVLHGVEHAAICPRCLQLDSAPGRWRTRTAAWRQGRPLGFAGLFGALSARQWPSGRANVGFELILAVPLLVSSRLALVGSGLAPSQSATQVGVEGW